MKKIQLHISVLLIFVLSATSFAQVAPKNALAGFHTGDQVAIRKTDGSELKGTLAAKTDTGVSLDVRKKGVVQIAYTDVRSAEAVRTGGGKAKWIVLGIVAAAAVVAGSIFAQRLHNEGAL